MQSSAILPPFAKRIKEEGFPRVTVGIKNEANHSVYLKCGFDRLNQDLQRLEPGQMTSWTLLEILFLLCWLLCSYQQSKSWSFLGIHGIFEMHRLHMEHKR
ncbi:hypothetical protein CRYUN_Cryun07bG0190400 [Craigia yunnanensis]